MNEDSGRGRRLAELDRDGIDGEDPMAERGPAEASPAAADCEHTATERSGPPEKSEYSMRDEIEEAFPIEELATPMAADGLPDHSVDVSSLAEAHPFTYASVCCVEDDRAYVELFEDEIAWNVSVTDAPLPRQRGWTRKEMPPEWPDADRVVEFRLAGVAHPIPIRPRARFEPDGSERARRRYGPDEVAERWGKLMAVGGERELDIPVRPVREACVFYKRQHFANDDAPLPDDPGHHIFFRNCTHPARRSIGGASMSLRDEAIYGCDYREPFDVRANAFIDAHDRDVLRRKPHLTRLPVFGLPGDTVALTDEER